MDAHPKGSPDLREVFVANAPLRSLDGQTSQQRPGGKLFLKFSATSLGLALTGMLQLHNK